MHRKGFVWLSDIRFWIALFFLLRLYGITLPPAEVGHAWRQVTVNMVARNFLETSPDIFLPRVDFAGEKSGITGMEFPLLNYLIYLVSLVAGFDHWYGRIINLIISSLGVWFFFLLLRKSLGESVAFFSTLVLLSSIWLNYARKIMPDTFSMSLVFMGLYAGIVYLERGRWLHLAASGILICLGILSKLPSLCMMPVMIFPLLDRTLPPRRKWSMLAVLAVDASLVSVWYFYWVPYLVNEYGFWHFYMGNSFAQGWNEILDNLPDTARKFYFSSLYSYVGFAAFLAGICLAFIRKEKKITHVFMLLTAVFIIFIIKAGYNFPHHNYYIIPYVPVMAMATGYLISQMKKAWIRFSLVAVIMLEGIINQQHDFRIKPDNRYLLDLEAHADRVSRRDDLIVINGGISPVDIYFTHRKGWTCQNEDLFHGKTLEEVSAKGCRYFFLNRHRVKGDEPGIPYRIVFENADLRIYDLRAPDD
ncbi:MAG: glycosyltransferase family 39 protein [Bacteroidales bacterium]|nr:glycosyltransferase family 39 protein [Lentimicrobiaceae bacterium]MDD5694411.1 glycosyltransferase family 39 protein [Bacteroidales bacterium]